MSASVVLSNNFADPETYTSFSYSSQLTAAPASNVLNFVRRSKVHRTQGYWLITSANKGIVLQEVAAANQTVNIAEGEYTSDTAFFAAVKTALDSASGSAVYTVTRDTTTNKIKITSDGGGGAIFRLMCTNASFTSASILGFSTAADRTGALTYTADTLMLHTEEFYVLDCGTSVNPSAFALIGKAGQAFGLTDSAVVTVMANHTNAWTSPAWSSAATVGEWGAMLYTSGGLAGASYRYWKVKIYDPSNPAGYLEIANLFLSETIAPSRGGVQFPLDINFRDPSETKFSERGNSFSNRRTIAKVLDIQWKGLTTANAEELNDFIEEVGTSKPFMMFMDTTDAFSTESGRQMRYGKLFGDPKLTLISPGHWGGSWQLREET